jgi:hypothetical protein
MAAPWTNRPATSRQGCVMRRTLTLTTAIWHNNQSGQPVLRSLPAYDP